MSLEFDCKLMQITYRATLSPYSEHLDDYVKAERTGKEVSECLPYIKKCPKSIFKSSSMSSMTVNSNSGQTM